LIVSPRTATLAATLLAALGTATASGAAVPSSEMPEPLKQVRYEQKIGAKIAPDLTFFDETGRAVRTGEVFARRPAILVLAYYHCPMLCDMVLQGVEGGLKALSLDPGRDFDVVVVSIDPRENPQLARKKKAEIVGRYKRPGTEGGWHFLTGTEKEIQALADTVGFHYVRDAVNDQFAHAAGLVMVAPGGTVSRYLFGIEFAPRDLKLGLIESAHGKLGNPPLLLSLRPRDRPLQCGHSSNRSHRRRRHPDRHRADGGPVAAAGDRSARSLGSRLT